jgi:toluene monooxygenase system protein B
MTALPLISNFQGDFVLQLIIADADGDMDDLAKVAAHHSVGRRVANQPGKVVRVRHPETTLLYPRNMKLSESGVQAMDCLEFVFGNPE